MTDKPTHTVSHPGLYKRINGRLQPLKVGSLLTLTRRQAAQMEKRGFAVAIAPEQTVREPVKPAQTSKKSKKTAKS